MLRELSNLVIQGKTVDHLGHQLETVTYFVLAGRCYHAPSISNLTLDEGFFLVNIHMPPLTSRVKHVELFR